MQWVLLPPPRSSTPPYRHLPLHSPQSDYLNSVNNKRNLQYERLWCYQWEPILVLYSQLNRLARGGCVTDTSPKLVVEQVHSLR